MNFSHLQYQLCNYSLSELVQAVQQQRLHLNAASVTRPWSAKPQQKLLNFIKQQLILPPFYLATAANITPPINRWHPTTVGLTNCRCATAA